MYQWLFYEDNHYCTFMRFQVFNKQGYWPMDCLHDMDNTVVVATVQEGCTSAVNDTSRKPKNRHKIAYESALQKCVRL
ncbi:MAG: hypothetical protein JWL77_938 [Chthonomonadaceae bacterium]|nr:hypothetical protein [Chthonomonadaceae bacterium]